jgi:hypothetical protein
MSNADLTAQPMHMLRASARLVNQTPEFNFPCTIKEAAQQYK